jgi:hypothetical protein
VDLSTVPDVLQSPTVARHASFPDAAAINRLTGTTSATSSADGEDSGEGRLGDEEISELVLVADGVTPSVLRPPGSADISGSGRSSRAMRKALTAMSTARSTKGSALLVRRTR